MRLQTKRISWLASQDQGSAPVEFTLLTTMLLVPVVYFLVLISHVLSAGYAVTATADQLAKVIGESSTDQVAQHRVNLVTEQVFNDYGLDPASAQVSISCSHTPCSEPGGIVSVQVHATVGLPFVRTVFGNETRIVTSFSTAHHHVGDFG